MEIKFKTARAWAYKEQFGEFWAQPDSAHGANFYAEWKRSVMRSRLLKVKAVAKTLHRHLTNLLTYFLYPITNAISAGSTSASKRSWLTLAASAASPTAIGLGFFFTAENSTCSQFFLPQPPTKKREQPCF